MYSSNLPDNQIDTVESHEFSPKSLAVTILIVKVGLNMLMLPKFE